MTSGAERHVYLESGQMSLLSIELSRERIRDAERNFGRRDIAQARAVRGGRPDVKAIVVRLRRLLTTR